MICAVRVVDDRMGADESVDPNLPSGNNRHFFLHCYHCIVSDIIMM